MLNFRISPKLSGLLLGALLAWPGLASATTTSIPSSTPTSNSKAVTPTTSTSPKIAPVTGTNGPPTVQQDLTAFHPVGNVVEVEQQLRFAGTAPQGFKVAIIPGFQQLQLRYSDPTTNKQVTGTYQEQGNVLTLEPKAQAVTMGYLIPMPTGELSWSAPIYYPTSVKMILSSPGLILTAGQNPDFHDMGSITGSVGNQQIPFERYASAPLQPDPHLVINLEPGTPTSAAPAPPKGATPASTSPSSLNSGVALGAVIAIIILVVVVFWYRNRLKSGGAS